MSPELLKVFTGELLGSIVLIAFGCSINMNLSLNKTYGAGNTASITGPLSWGFAISMAVIVSAPFDTGGHFNPALSIGLALTGLFPWEYVPTYVVAQFIGCFIGALIPWFLYGKHLDATKNEPAKLLGVFATNSSIRENNFLRNFSSELIATFFLVCIVTSMYTLGTVKNVTIGEMDGTVGFSAVGALPAGFMIFAIGMAFGGLTGWSMNPARDLMPRLAHAILPIKGKGGSDWAYGIVVASIAPLIGAVLAGLFYFNVVLPIFYK